MSTTVIPPPVISRVREGAFSGLRDCAEGIDHAGYDPDEHERVRQRLQATWRLLDVIGWSAGDDQLVTGVEIDASQHGEALLTALGIMLPLLEGWLQDIPDFDSRRPGKQAEVESMREFEAQVRRHTGRQR